jgi:hypothetical protein
LLGRRNKILVKRLSEHENNTKFLNAINKLFKTKFMVYYYIGIPFIDLFLILVMDNQIKPAMRILVMLPIINSTLPVLAINYMISSVSTSAHSPFAILNSLIAKSKNNMPVMPVSLRLKVIQLIDKLSGPKIGFTCYDFFTFANFELFLFYSNVSASFFLFLNFIDS